jgi:hypothetical protein
MHLRECDGYTESALCLLACLCVNLRGLQLEFWDDQKLYSAAVIQTFAERCDHLEGVQLYFPCSQNTLNLLTVHSGARLRYLSLQTAQFRKDAGLLS